MPGFKVIFFFSELSFLCLMKFFYILKPFKNRLFKSILESRQNWAQMTPCHHTCAASSIINIAHQAAIFVNNELTHIDTTS